MKLDISKPAPSARVQEPTDNLTSRLTTLIGLPGKLLAGGDVIAQGVIWAVSLRPYAPTIPPLKGGEFALATTDALARQDPPVTLADVVKQLQARGASGLAVRGDIDEQAIVEANRVGLPLVWLPMDVSLHEIEQAIMRECALVQARREIMAAEEPGAWVGRLLAGKTASVSEVQIPARREGYTLSVVCSVVYVTAMGSDPLMNVLDQLVDALVQQNQKRDVSLVPYKVGDGLAVLLPPAGEDNLRLVLRELKLACGIGSERPLLDAPTSYGEARLAALSSMLLHEGAPILYNELGVERMLLLLYKDNMSELESFVIETLGPLLRHDARSATLLLPTIAAFVGHGGRLRETALEIYVHRNTLAYRLDRAAEILGADLKDADTRLAIELALRAMPLVRKRET